MTIIQLSAQGTSCLLFYLLKGFTQMHTNKQKSIGHSFNPNYIAYIRTYKNASLLVSETFNCNSQHTQRQTSQLLSIEA